MLNIKKSKAKEEWIVFNSDNFDLHTHCRSQRVAVAIKRTVEHHEIPKSKDIRFIDSCMRVTTNKAYIRKLEAYRTYVKEGESNGRNQEGTFMDRQE